MFRERLRRWGVPIIIGFGAGVLISICIDQALYSHIVAEDQLSHEVRSGGYRFINPLLQCDQSEAIASELRPFRQKIEQVVASQIRQGKIDFAAVYFRDLNNGPWFGINEREPFRPASLLKVPLMMAVLAEAERDPGFLSQTVSGVKGVNLQTQHFKPAKEIESNKTYTVGELVEYMTRYSDNKAANVLLGLIGKEKEAQIYFELGIEPPSNGPENYISVKNYASFFRVLFNASFLGRNLSDRALELLTLTDFKEALPAGISKDIKVAHKFGEFRYPADEGSVNQLHDCGIVYYPRRPYLACIMTRGDSFDVMPSAIAKISEAIYKEVDRQVSASALLLY